MVIYIDKDYKCHAEAAEGLVAYDVPFFDGKCEQFIEGYRYIPAGETWVREDGMLFKGEMIAPFVDYVILDNAQKQAEIKKLTAQINALSTQIDFQEECLVEMASIVYA